MFDRVSRPAAGKVQADVDRIDRIEGLAAATSLAEQRFDRVRQRVGFVLGPLALVAGLLAPAGDLSWEAHRLGAVMLLVVVWSVTEPVPLAVTALIGASLAVVLGIAPVEEVFAPFANPVIFLFLGSFMLGRAATEHGLDRRIATALLSLATFRGSFRRLASAVCGLTFALSAWLSNTATAAMMLPLANGVLRAAPGSGRSLSPRSQTGLLIAIAYAASIGGVITPVGSPPNLITIGLLDTVGGYRVNFVVWMAVALPIAIVVGLALQFLTVARFGDSGGSRGPETSPLRLATRSGPWTTAQLNCAFAFAVAVVLWITPGLLNLVNPDAALARWMSTHLEESVVALLAACLLFVLPARGGRRRFTLDWHTATQIDWGTILLFGGGLALGGLMFTTGLAGFIGDRVIAVSGAQSLWAITFVGLVLSVLLTEIVSNTAAANMLIPVIISIAQASGVSPVPPAMAVGLGASMSFMLPVSTPPNAMVYGTGQVPVLSMIRYGAVMDVVSIVVIFAGLRLLCPLMGLV